MSDEGLASTLHKGLSGHPCLVRGAHSRPFGAPNTGGLRPTLDTVRWILPYVSGRAAEMPLGWRAGLPNWLVALWREPFRRTGGSRPGRGRRPFPSRAGSACPKTLQEPGQRCPCAWHDASLATLQDGGQKAPWLQPGDAWPFPVSDSASL